MRSFQLVHGMRDSFEIDSGIPFCKFNKAESGLSFSKCRDGGTRPKLVARCGI